MCYSVLLIQTGVFKKKKKSPLRGDRCWGWKSNKGVIILYISANRAIMKTSFGNPDLNHHNFFNLQVFTTKTKIYKFYFHIHTGSVGRERRAAEKRRSEVRWRRVQEWRHERRRRHGYHVVEPRPRAHGHRRNRLRMTSRRQNDACFLLCAIRSQFAVWSRLMFAPLLYLNL